MFGLANSYKYTVQLGQSLSRNNVILGRNPNLTSVLNYTKSMAMYGTKVFFNYAMLWYFNLVFLRFVW